MYVRIFQIVVAPRLWGRYNRGCKSRKGEQIFRFSKTYSPGLGLRIRLMMATRRPIHIV